MRPAFGACIAAALIGHAALLEWARPQGQRARTILPAVRLVALEAPSPARHGPAQALAEARPAPDDAKPGAAASPAEGARPRKAHLDHGPRQPGPLPPLDYLPTAALDRPALARAAPDVSLLQGLPWSGLPLRLRVYIDATGRVTEVIALRSSEAPEVFALVRRMLLATAYLPGRVQGRDVASFEDIELQARLPLTSPNP